jgi:DNA-binding transcriptional regulator/RsmH inhibitor MraZ
MDHAGIKDKVILVGAMTRVQIWEPSAWKTLHVAPSQWLQELEAIEKRPRASE